jgi:hypothetical protein
MHHLTRVSRNTKTGPIPVSTHTKDSCPDSCKLKGAGCYAKGGPLAIHWGQVTSGKRGTSWSEFCDQIKALPRGQLWRYAQAGDLPGVGDTIDIVELDVLVSANRGKKGFTYTHKPLSAENRTAVEAANDKGFTINISHEAVYKAIATHKSGLPSVVVLPRSAPNTQTIDNVQVVACPAEKSDKVSCSTCALCADSKRNYVIGFRAHGSQAKKVERLIETVSV